MKTLILVPLIFSILSCNTTSDSKNKIATSSNEDTTKFLLLKYNLFIDRLGNIAFKTVDKSDPQKPVDRFITTVWNADLTDSINNGKMEMKDVIDTASFKQVKGIYYQDKNHFYVYNQMADGGNFAVLQNIDPETFLVISPFYAKDKSHVFYGSRIIKEADVSTFKPLPKVKNNDTVWQYAQDKNHFYYFGDIIKREQIQ